MLQKLKKSVNKSYAVAVIIIIILICICACNTIHNDKFFEMSLFNVMTIFIALLFTFIFDQKINQEHKMCDKVENFSNKIIVLLSDERLFNIKAEDDVMFIRIRKSTISNKIRCLEEIAEKAKVSNEVKIIRDKFNDYENFLITILKI